eukprot:221976_1
MGQCCTSRPEHRIKSNTQPLFHEKKQLIDNPNTQTQKTNVDQIIPETDEETDDQQNNITTPKQQIKNKPLEIDSIDANPLNHIISTNNNELNHSYNIHMPSPQQTDTNINDNDNNDMKQQQQLLIDKQLTDTNNTLFAINQSSELFDEKKHYINSPWLPLQKCNHEYLFDLIEKQKYNDVDYKKKLRETMTIFSNSQLNGQKAYHLTGDDLKCITKHNLQKFMTEETINIMFDYFDKFKEQQNIKIYAAPDIAS